jgi:hypothetical protein
MNSPGGELGRAAQVQVLGRALPGSCTCTVRGRGSYAYSLNSKSCLTKSSPAPQYKQQRQSPENLIRIRGFPPTPRITTKKNKRKQKEGKRIKTNFPGGNKGLEE